MSDQAARIVEHLGSQRAALEDFIVQLARVETPSRSPDTHPPAFAILAEALRGLDFAVTVRPADERHGGLLHATMPGREEDPRQLLLGHIDTVWPLGTLAEMPLHQDAGVLSGPGVYDMKGGLAQIVFAFRALEALDLVPDVAPEVLVNSDEEIGSRASTALITERARGADRALVMEPAVGPDGRLKTARKGLGRFTIVVKGRAAHAGLDPEAGASAILELSHQVQRLFALNDPSTGVTVNVGTIDGGISANVVAPESRAVVDVRVPTHEDAARVEAAIRALAPVTDGVTLEIDGGFGRPPMEVTPASTRLWEVARRAGEQLGLDLDHASVGGGSDGNTTAQHTPTLDGLGPVGAGAHAPHEHLVLDRLLERTALLALILLAPPLGAAQPGGSP